MISYAQNFEDVMLARVFGDRRDGFYVDIGACFPDVASVTRHFYDLGWSGINVEPMAEPFARLEAERPRDVNLNLAIARRSGQLPMFAGPSIGESSAVRPHATARPELVPCTTLEALCRLHVTRPIDFLKIDVEGLEYDVIAGGDWDAYRPTIVVVEVTLPWSTTRAPAAELIATHLAGHGYREVYFDGLNAFYLAQEAEALATRFSAPPNALDRFILAGEAEAQTAVTELRTHSANVEQALRAAQTHGANAEQALRAALTQGANAEQALRAAQTQGANAERALQAAAMRAADFEQRCTENLARAEAAELRCATAESRASAAENAAEAAVARIGAVAAETEAALRAQIEALSAQVERGRLQDVEMTQRLQASEQRVAALAGQLESASIQLRGVTEAAGQVKIELASAQERARALERRADAAEARSWDLEVRSRQAELAFESLVNSRSWRITAPLRWVRHAVWPLSATADARARQPSGSGNAMAAGLGASLGRRASLIARRWRVFDRRTPTQQETGPISMSESKKRAAREALAPSLPPAEVPSPAGDGPPVSPSRNKGEGGLAGLLSAPPSTLSEGEVAELLACEVARVKH